MRFYSRYMGQWGHDSIPTDEIIPSYKFMNLHKPIHEEFGGHYHLSGAYGVYFYGQDQMAVCEKQDKMRQRPDLYPNVKWHEIPGPNRFEPDSCDCGIHSQTLNNIHDAHDFRMDSLIHMDHMFGNTDYTDAGYRAAHGRIQNIWTSIPLDNDQLEKVHNDLGAKVHRVPPQFIDNYGKVDWPSFIDNHPDLSAFLPKERAMHKEWDRTMAAVSLDPNKDIDHEPTEHPCPDCGSGDLGLVSDPRGHSYGRLGKCFNCGKEWDRYND